MLDARTVPVVDELTELATDRRVALRLLWLLDDPQAPLDEIGRVISADPALSARVLAVANAPFYGSPGKVTTVNRAVALLGTTTVRTFATSSALELFSMREKPLPDRFWLHSVTTAVAAASLANFVGVNSAEAMAAGLLHDIGSALLHQRDPEVYARVERLTAFETDERRLAAERHEFGIDHATAGADALEGAGVPERLTAALRHHHDPSSPDPLARLVVAADRLADAIDGGSIRPGRELAPTLAKLGVDEARTGQLVARVGADQRTVLDFLANFLATPSSRGA